MVTTVTGKNQITLPVEVTQQMGIHRGSKIEWKVDKKGKEGRFRVLPSQREQLLQLAGMGRKYLKPGETADDWIKALDEERDREDLERMEDLG